MASVDEGEQRESSLTLKKKKGRRSVPHARHDKRIESCMVNRIDYAPCVVQQATRGGISRENTASPAIGSQSVRSERRREEGREGGGGEVGRKEERLRTAGAPLT